MWGQVLTSLAKAVSVTIPNIRPRHIPLPLTLQANRLARLAPASAVLTTTTTTILATVAHGVPTTTTPSNPLLVDFRSKAAAVGVIPSTWSRREQQPALFETATSRLIDRSLRPALRNIPNLPPTHITVSVLSAARQTDAPLDVLAVNAASAALSTLTNLDFEPVTAARVAIVGDECVPFPSDDHIQNSDLSVYAAVNAAGNILALSIQAITRPAQESLVMRAVSAAVDSATAMQATFKTFSSDVQTLRDADGFSSFPPQILQPPTKTEADDLHQRSAELVYCDAYIEYEKAFVECRTRPGKAHRAAVMTRVQNDIATRHTDLPIHVVQSQLSRASHAAHRTVLLRDARRMDGRAYDEVRPIRCETSVLPGDVHGSAIFERGDTQVLAFSTFGHRKQSRRTEEYLDGADDSYNGLFVHYSFPSFATGEYGRFAQQQNRREVGHSLLTEKAIAPLLGDENDVELERFPYALRVSTEVLGSDGSSSMASVCAGSLAIMDAGGPLREPVAGIAMGLISNDSNETDGLTDDVILTDILGAEDHFGDLDMKVAGTISGITVSQLDVKKKGGVSVETIEKILNHAKTGRAKILAEMSRGGLDCARAMAENAPRVVRVEVDRERARVALYKDRFRGLRAIGKECDSMLLASEDGGEVVIEAPNKTAAEKAKILVKEAVREIRVGDTMTATVMDVKKSFARVEATLGCVSGILHASKIKAVTYKMTGETAVPFDGGKKPDSLPSFGIAYPDVRRFLSVGDEIQVRVIEADESNSVLRFQYVSHTIGQASQLASEIDSILNAVKA